MKKRLKCVNSKHDNGTQFGEKIEHFRDDNSMLQLFLLLRLI